MVRTLVDDEQIYILHKNLEGVIYFCWLDGVFELKSYKTEGRLSLDIVHEKSLVFLLSNDCDRWVNTNYDPVIWK